MVHVWWLTRFGHTTLEKGAANQLEAEFRRAASTWGVGWVAGPSRPLRAFSSLCSSILKAPFSSLCSSILKAPFSSLRSSRHRTFRLFVTQGERTVTFSTADSDRAQPVCQHHHKSRHPTIHSNFKSTRSCCQISLLDSSCSNFGMLFPFKPLGVHIQ
jgi:hypothetical protein